MNVMKAVEQTNGSWVPCKLIGGTWYPMPRFFSSEAACLAFMAGAK